jgi:tRNA 2-thiocytidine biosynthesis protein TtcA
MDYKRQPWSEGNLGKYGRFLLKKINRVFTEYPMIRGGDRVCVAVSGGKDSLSLLWLLHEHRRMYNEKYEIAAAHVVSDLSPGEAETHLYLEKLFSETGIPCEFIPVSITLSKEGNPNSPSCFWCAWNRRRALFKHCDRHGFNKLAFGHHADDVAETTLLNLIYHGNLETMLPAREFFDGRFSVIRPMFHVYEKELLRYSGMAGFKTSSCVCPNSDTSKRKMAKNLVAEL